MSIFLIDEESSVERLYNFLLITSIMHTGRIATQVCLLSAFMLQDLFLMQWLNSLQERKMPDFEGLSPNYINHIGNIYFKLSLDFGTFASRTFFGTVV